MKKYTVFRMPDEEDENYDQHELVGIEYGRDIDAAADALIQTVREDLSENPEYAGCEMLAYPPEAVEGFERYPYQITGVVAPPNAPENILVFYGITEAEDN